MDAPTPEELIRDAQTEANKHAAAQLKPRLVKAKIVEVGPGGRFHGKFTFRVDGEAE